MCDRNYCPEFEINIMNMFYLQNLYLQKDYDNKILFLFLIANSAYSTLLLKLVIAIKTNCVGRCTIVISISAH